MTNRLRVGKPVRGSESGRPIMVLLDLLGRRWALRILWELREGPLTFRGLQERCDGMSPSVLNQRMTELRDAGLVDRGDTGYSKTAQGEELGEILMALHDYSEGWAAQPSATKCR